MEYIYFIQESFNGFVKIGRSTNVGTRMAELQIGNPAKLKLVYCVEIKRRTWKEQGGRFYGACCYENVLHKLFNEYLVRGEWFDGLVLSHLPKSPKELVPKLEAKYQIIELLSAQNINPLECWDNDLSLFDFIGRAQ